jgi:ADP-heptose:LPS heptosyltransferase
MNTKVITLPERARILVARTDRIGDLVLSLPVFTSLKSAFPRSSICALVRNQTAELLAGRPDVDDVISFDSDTARIPWGEFKRLLPEIVKRKFDAAVILFSNFSVTALAAVAGIPVRVGPATKIAQALLTHRVRQRRSKTLRHETDHNLDISTVLGAPPIRVAFIAPPSPPMVRLAKADGRPLVGVHPGSGGSARNWPEKRYVELIRELTGAGCDVVVTGSTAEKELVERVIRSSGALASPHIGNGKLMELASALSQMDVFVAGSTGPLHMASALGTPVVGIYCPIFVCLPQRWGPIGPKDTALVPNVAACAKCVMEKCPHYDCMEMISVGLVRDSVMGKTGVTVGLLR